MYSIYDIRYLFNINIIMIYISFDIGVKNLALCVLKYEDTTISILDWRIITLAETKKEIKGIDDLSERLFMELDNIVGSLKYISIETIDYVLIENQPSNLNGVMKTIQHIIYTYFSLLKYWEKIIDKIVLVNASLKLKNHDYSPEIGFDSECKKNSKGFTRDKYKWNKASSIAICRHYIKYSEELKRVFETNKKKDDLADSCLQAVSFIRNILKTPDLLNKTNSITMNDMHLLDTK